jgi:hypothetical protein
MRVISIQTFRHPQNPNPYLLKIHSCELSFWLTLNFLTVFLINLYQSKPTYSFPKKKSNFPKIVSKAHISLHTWQNSNLKFLRYQSFISIPRTSRTLSNPNTSKIPPTNPLKLHTKTSMSPNFYKTPIFFYLL